MKYIKVPNGKSGFYSTFQTEDVEYIDPKPFFQDVFVTQTVIFQKDLIALRKPPLPMPMVLIEQYLYSKLNAEWEQQYKIFMETEIPQNFITLLKTQSKKEQVQLLKNQSLTSEQLLAFILQSCANHGFKFSEYKSEHFHDGLDQADLPQVIEIMDGTVNKVGQTPLSDGQLRQAVLHRNIVISKFLDNNDSWHCLFLTFKSIQGEESWKDGQPHFHYISDKFGIPREKVVYSLKSKNYNLGSLPHVDLLNFRPPK